MLFKVAHEKEIHVINSKDKSSLIELKKALPTVFKRLPEKYSLSYIDADKDEITLTNQNDFNILLLSDLKTVKIFIKERSEEFYDQTQEVVLEEEKVELPIKEVELVELPILEANECSSIMSKSEFENIDAAIENKIKELMPSIIQKVKTQISEQSKISSSRITQPISSGKVMHSRINCDGCGKHGIEGVRYKCAVCPDFDFCENCEATIDHDHAFLKIKTLKQTPYKIIAVIDDDHDSFEVNGNRFNAPGLQNLFTHGLNLAQQFMSQAPEKKQQVINQCKEAWMNFKKQECPFKNQQTKAENVEVKIEEPVKVEESVKVEVSIKKVEQPEVKKEEKSEIKELPKRSLEDIQIESANYLSDILEKDFSRCLKLAKQYPELSQEELLEVYFNNPRII